MTANDDLPVVVLGAGYAGIALSHAFHRASKGRIPLVVVDRHASHTIRTRLYEVGRLAESEARPGRWSVPIDQVLAHDEATFLEGEVRSIDVAGRSVRVGDRTVPYRALAIALGNEAAYYGIPGAAELTEQVYRFAGAIRLARRLREAAQQARVDGRPAHVVVVGGGSTGTEVAAEIATTDWSKIVGAPTTPFAVTLVIGAVPFLAGLPDPLIRHARRLLDRARVATLPDRNVARVDPGRLTLQDGTALPADVVVWCAGLAASPVVRELPVPHGKGGRIAVEDTLEVPGHPGLFALGDSAELREATTGLLVPGTAQAALAEAPVAGWNLEAFLSGRPYRHFQYRERGVVVAVGRGRGSGRVAGVSVWGRPAALVKAAVDAEYESASRHGRDPRGI